MALCGRQGLALRGENDSDVTREDNRSNFSALPGYSIQSGDSFLENHIKTCDRGATYTSGKTQNRLIDIFGDQILSQLFEEVKKPSFSLCLQMRQKMCQTGNR